MDCTLSVQTVLIRKVSTAKLVRKVRITVHPTNPLTETSVIGQPPELWNTVIQRAS